MLFTNNFVICFHLGINIVSDLSWTLDTSLATELRGMLSASLSSSEPRRHLASVHTASSKYYIKPDQNIFTTLMFLKAFPAFIFRVLWHFFTFFVLRLELIWFILGLINYCQATEDGTRDGDGNGVGK